VGRLSFSPLPATEAVVITPPPTATGAVLTTGSAGAETWIDGSAGAAGAGKLGTPALATAGAMADREMSDTASVSARVPQWVPFMPSS
jgi:hypothetical protein